MARSTVLKGMVWLVFLLQLVLIAPLQAHELRPSIADISIEGESLDIALQLNLEAVLAELGPEHEDSDDAPNAIRYNELRALDDAILQQRIAAYATVFQKRISLQTQSGQLVAPRIISAEIPEVGDVRIARDSQLQLVATLPPATISLSWQWDKLYGPIILRVGDTDSADAFSQYLTPGKQSADFSTGSPVARSTVDVIVDYVKLGYVHILPKGLDHILFVIGLFLLSPRWRPILWQVSAFTIAHTITLAIGVLGYIQVPASIVEPLIALSISAVCLENLVTTKIHAWRIYIVIGFGLLHGLGFAGVLGEIGLTQNAIFTALISFNVGVELGQLSVILACFILIGWLFRRKSWYRRRLTNPLSMLLASIGLILFANRIWAEFA